ncbi:hypothetical protein [Devosia chinhatensis]|uniref:DUF1217 domain-containing protein n=1 Tax=Devosia chinhatensis TaxID=429727 RepID=A0A0F5FPN9_9HYPH|nr:hypothetical protein [Devosia chinhatensis]KKB10137.1 hypothetical protein VE26_10235 [Devosia chinhatensis]
MVTISTTAPYAAYQGYQPPYASSVKSSATPQQARATDEDTATSVTLSEAARAAMAERTFAQLVADTHGKLAALLAEADRTSPLKDGKLALDLSTIDHRELFAMSSDESFTADARDAAGLEMQRRFEAALAGPAAIAKVTGNYSGLYKAAAAHLDALGPEERASADWKAGRDAVTEGLKQLQASPGTLPEAGDADPVALYLALSVSGEQVEASLPELAANARTTLDRLYAEAKANGKVPTFNRQTRVGQYIDVSDFSSRVLSSMVLDKEGRFSLEETNAARTALQSRSGATLLAGFQSASKSGDPTAFSQNIISAFSSLSADERQAVGWSDQLYQAAMQSYVTTSKLMDMFGQATSGANTGGGVNLATLLGGR